MRHLRHLPPHSEQEATATASALLSFAPVATIALGVGVLLVCGLPLCPFASLTGIPCPGCGLLRATLALAHGDIGAALRYHPLVLAALPLGAACVAHSTTSWPRGARGQRCLGALTMVMVTSFAAVWLARLSGHLGGPVTVRTFWQ